eukprot:665843_1
MTYENGSDEENSSHVQMIQSMVCTTDAISLEICMRTYIIEFIPHTLDYKQHELQSTTAKFDGLSEQHNEVGLCDILRIDSDTLKQMEERVCIEGARIHAITRRKRANDPNINTA